MVKIQDDEAAGDGARNPIAIARESLSRARAHLDAAVLALPERGGDNAMATPSLLALLLHAVAARRDLNRLESALADAPGDVIRLVAAAPDGDPWP